MNRMKKWSVSITSWVDKVLGEIENHDALVVAAVDDVSKMAARARIQLRRVQNDVRSLKRGLAHEEEQVVVWKERARQREEESEAIECLRRSKRAEARVAELSDQLAEHEKAEKSLHEGITKLHTRIGELTKRRNLMRTRESHASAMKGCTELTDPIGNLEDIFERWDARIAELEIRSDFSCDYHDPSDEFERDLIEEEESDALRSELYELRNLNA